MRRFLRTQRIENTKLHVNNRCVVTKHCPLRWAPVRAAVPRQTGERSAGQGQGCPSQGRDPSRGNMEGLAGVWEPVGGGGGPCPPGPTFPGPL